MPTETTYALHRADGTVAPERFTEAEAQAAMRLDPWLADRTFGNDGAYLAPVAD